MNAIEDFEDMVRWRYIY